MAHVTEALTLHVYLTARSLFGVWQELRQNPSALLATLVVGVYILIAVFGPVIAPYPPSETALVDRLQEPGAEHWLGTDGLGRDILSRCIYGGRLDAIFSRMREILMAFPYLISAIAMMAFLGPGFFNLIWALALRGWVEFFRLARGDTLSQQTREYVDAARSLGQPGWQIMLSEILPNIVPSIIVLATLRVGFMIVLEASLSFLGVGIPPSIPAWGSMISEGRGLLFTAWWVSTLPGLILMVLVLAINLLGEGLREVLDPRLKVQT